MMGIVLFIKAHVSGYTRKDGTYVAPHEDKRAAAKQRYEAYGNEKFQKYGAGWVPKATDDERAEYERLRVEMNEAHAAPVPVQKPAPKKKSPAKKKVAAKKVETGSFGAWRGESGFMWPEGDTEPIIIFHNGYGDDVFVVKDSADRPVDFGGIFAGPGAGMDGDKRYAAVLDPNKGLTHGEFNQLPWEDASAALKEDFPNGLSDDDLDFLWDFIDESRFSNDHDVADHEDEERLEHILSQSRSLRAVDGSLEYAAQRLRGLVAKKLGYQWVHMKDETGVSTLVLPGVELRAIPEGESFNDAESRISDLWEQDKKARGTMTKAMPNILLFRRVS